MTPYPGLHGFTTLRFAALCLLTGCAFEPPLDEPSAAEPAEPDELNELGMRIPVAFDPACRALADLPEPPPGLTVAEFFDCLSDESWHALDALYRREAARAATPATPATLDELVARYGDRPVAEVPLRELAFGAPQVEDVRADGVAPTHLPRYRYPSQYGLDATTCGTSCLSAYVNVVGGRRHIGFAAIQKGAVAPKDDQNKRYLDEIYPGTFPDFRQSNLANAELREAGCGPVSAINLYEWWGIPVYDGASEKTSFDTRASYIAGRMSTLNGVNYTDDDALIDFVANYPRELHAAGRIPGYPAYHYMRDDPEGWKVMMSYLARGFPVIALYSTGAESQHWALITGVKGGKLLIGNGNDRTLADFFNQWQDWEALEWYAEVGAGLMVSKSTFVALTGWDSAIPKPNRFAARVSKAYLPSYTSSSTSYQFRYCVGSSDEIGRDAEALHVGAWATEPSGSLPGYCMFLSPTSAPTITPSPSGGSASSVRGAELTLSVANSSTLRTLVTNSPGVRCYWYGLENGTWTKLASRLCSESGARAYTFTNNGQYTKVSFHVHSIELAKTRWNVTATD